MLLLPWKLLRRQQVPVHRPREDHQDATVSWDAWYFDSISQGCQSQFPTSRHAEVLHAGTHEESD
eukprot:12293113-Prorocentrum_lima.AAC.1